MVALEQPLSSVSGVSHVSWCFLESEIGFMFSLVGLWANVGRQTAIWMHVLSQESKYFSSLVKKTSYWEYPSS